MTRRRLAGMLAIVVAIVVAVGATWAVSRSPSPGPSSVAVGFAQDMSVHHAQAVEMAGLVLQRTEDDAVQTLARDIMLTQQGQIGQMHGWLDLWDQPKTTVGPRMVWMTSDGMGMDGRMPGMAAPEDIAGLRSLQGQEAERLFLQLMIEHHRAGIDMDGAAVASTTVPDVRRLARTMVTGQETEIEAMAGMLDERGGQLAENP